MKKNVNILLLAFSIFLVFSLVVFLFHNIVVMSDLVSSLHPGAGLFLKYALSLLVLAGLCWLLGAFVIRPEALIPPVDPTPEEKARYLKRLDRRLRKNKLLRQSGTCRESDSIEIKLSVLEAMANEEIRSAAKKVFLSTAVSQNGRLDSLVVFLSTAFLVWKVSHIYNQRPSLKEMYSIYLNVVGSSFVSYGIDEIDIKTQINALVEPLMAHAVGHVPIVSSITSSFANAFFHGAVNCILVSRVGLLTKNYISMGYDLDNGLRKSSFQEAVSFARDVFTGSFKELKNALCEVASAPLEKLKTKTARAAKSASERVGDVCGAVADGAKSGVQKTAEAVSSAGCSVATGAKAARGRAVDACGSMKDGTVAGAQKAVGAISSAGHKVASLFKGKKKAEPETP
ncbi:MAG: DUF697 domain-containing protein [Desulfovibrio sp.]|nr:DUF697 domain-containing protein [Desulfovibrio sp.]MBI4958252.1 DUF697 domain-containing protein [Desulfovibrio sp.]